MKDGVHTKAQRRKERPLTSNAEIARAMVVTRETARGWEVRLPGVAGLATLKTKTIPRTRREAEDVADYFRRHVTAILDRAEAMRAREFAERSLPCEVCETWTTNRRGGRAVCDDCYCDGVAAGEE